MLSPGVALSWLLASLTALLFGYAAHFVYRIFVFPVFFSAMRELPGPISRGLFHSQLGGVMEPEISCRYHDEYVQKYGKTFRLYGMGKHDPRLFTLDPRAMLHVLNNTAIYPKPWQSRRIISELIGNGLFASEGPSHRRQRKVMNPAFSNQNLQALAPIFMNKANELRDIWLASLPIGSGSSKVDVCHWISRATFDIIGLAGFDYAFNALRAEDNEVYRAYKDMFDIGLNRGFSLKVMISIYIPFIKTLLPDERSRTIRKSHEVIYRVGRHLLDEKKAEVLESKAGAGSHARLRSKDLLTLLICSNSEGVPDNQRVSDEDILDQINSFFFAGSDSTSLALCWTLHLLAMHPAVQARLRLEMYSIDKDSAFSAIDALPLLDKVCKEELRLIPPVHSSLRVAMKDDIVPVSEPIRLKDGTVVNEIRVPKGTLVHVPIEGFNLLTDVWGADAHEFNPDRWDDLPAAAKAQPGLYSNIMSFSAGPRACIGQRFSLIEMKTFLFVLVRAFEFVQCERIVKQYLVLTRPFVKGKIHLGPQLPLMIRRAVPP